MDRGEGPGPVERSRGGPGWGRAPSPSPGCTVPDAGEKAHRPDGTSFTRTCRSHAAGKRGNGHGGRGHGRPLGGRREKGLAKSGHAVPTQEEPRWCARARTARPCGLYRKATDCPARPVAVVLQSRRPVLHPSGRDAPPKGSRLSRGRGKTRPAARKRCAIGPMRGPGASQYGVPEDRERAPLPPRVRPASSLTTGPDFVTSDYTHGRARPFRPGSTPGAAAPTIPREGTTPPCGPAPSDRGGAVFSELRPEGFLEVRST